MIRTLGSLLGAVVWGAAVYAVCVWLLRIGDQTSLLVGFAVGALALVADLVQLARRRRKAHRQALRTEVWVEAGERKEGYGIRSVGRRRIHSLEKMV